MFDGGMSATLGDLARFGLMILRNGTSLTGEQVVPSWWIDDSFAGGPDSVRAFADSPGDNRMPGGLYRNQFWIPDAQRPVLLCLGIHGQMIYVNREAGVVAAKLSSWPTPAERLEAVLHGRRLRRDQPRRPRRLNDARRAPGDRCGPRYRRPRAGPARLNRFS